MSMQCNHPNVYHNCKFCKLIKLISYYIFKSSGNRFCVHFFGYRFEHTKDQLEHYAERYNIIVRSYEMSWIQALIASLSFQLWYIGYMIHIQM